jgi:hypothetical protein
MTTKQIFAKACGAVLLIATCMGLSSCIVVERHHRHYRDGYGYGYSQEVRP